MATSQQIAFSECGEFLAHSYLDGILRIFETSTGILKQEYSSSTHLSAATSALSWSRQRKDSTSTPKAKRKKLDRPPDQDVYQDDLMLIALGTTTGTVDLYSFAKGELHTQLKGGHALKVNDVCWHLSDPELFTCSEDQHVVQWNLSKGKVKHKWKCDTTSIHSVSHISQNKLLTASHSIKLWDLTSRTVLQTFTGHSSPIFRLLPVKLPSSGDGASSDMCYVLSAALDDRHINVWYCSGSSDDKASLVSFSVPDEVVSMSLGKGLSTSQAMLLAVITVKGAVHLFEHTLNGKRKKPLLCKSTIRGVCANKENEEMQLPILATDINGSRITVALGDAIRPQFETVVYDSSNPEVKISVKKRSISLKKEEFSQVKKPDTSRHITTLVPAESQPKLASKNKELKRQRRSSVSDLSMEERLNAMSSDTPVDATPNQRPVANTLSRLLQQGLQSGDQHILTRVFQETNEMVVRTTIKTLPLGCIIPFVEQLEKGMSKHAQQAMCLSRWATALIAHRTSYILSVPEVISTLNRLYQTLTIRQKFFPKMLQLKGRLELIGKQGNSTDKEEDDILSEPLLVHQDESDSEDSDSMEIDGPIVESDEENWDDLSDME